VGAPRWLAFIVILWGALAMALAMLRTADDFVLLRLLLGVAESGTFPGLWYHLALFYPNDSLTMPIVWTKVAVQIAQVLSAPLAAALVSMHGVAGLAGWQWLFLLEGAPTVLVGVALLVLLPATPAAVTTLTLPELAWVRDGVGSCALGSSVGVRGLGVEGQSSGEQFCVRKWRVTTVQLELFRPLPSPSSLDPGHPQARSCSRACGRRLATLSCGG